MIFENKEPCDYCEWAGLFYCNHANRWIKPFRFGEDCELFKPLPNGETRSKVKDYMPCSACKKEVHIDELEVYAKGAKMLCKRCQND